MRSFKDYTDYLFNIAPLFQNIGKDAYKGGLDTTTRLDSYFHHPHTQFKSIHIAGTNGKGSCSHTIASVLQQAGYKVGLYTSPHLLSFTERIRVNGKAIEEEYVMDFIDANKDLIESLHPSFFEITTALAFRYFADKEIDIAVVEVGLGGRLDCTNIITPILSIITNISKDHVQFLGDTLGKIAWEKAGIMKRGIDCVIGETTNETLPVFENHAKEVGTNLIFTTDDQPYPDKDYSQIFELKGLYQKKNLATILTALNELQKKGLIISDNDIVSGLSHVIENTGLRGRWEKIQDNPTIICDTGHNIGGFKYISEQLMQQKCKALRIVIGMVNDKDVSGVLALFPKEATYYFCQASVKRALSASELKEIAQRFHLHGNAFTNVMTAVDKAKEDADRQDFIFVGGSTFVVADFLSFL